MCGIINHTPTKNQNPDLNICLGLPSHKIRPRYLTVAGSCGIMAGMSYLQALEKAGWSGEVWSDEGRRLYMKTIADLYAGLVGANLTENDVISR